MNSFSTSHSHPPKHITDHNRLALLSVFLRRTKVARSLPATLSTWIPVCLLLTVHCLLPTGLSAQQTQPVLDWSTYFDGSTRNDGLKYVVGDDGSIWFGHLVENDGAGTPISGDAWQTSYFAPGANQNFYNSYIGKLSPDGDFEYGSYFGSNRGDFTAIMGQDENYVYALNFIYRRETTVGVNWPSTGNNYGTANRGGANNDQGFYQLVKIEKSTNTPVLVTELPGTEYLFSNVNGVIRSNPNQNALDIQTKDGYAYFAGRSVRRPRVGLNESWAYIIAPDHTGTLIRLNRRDAVDHAVRVGDYIAADNGDFIIYGGSRGNGALGDAAFQTTDNTVFTNPVGNWDTYLRRYDRDGNLIFSTLLGGTGTELTYDGGAASTTKVVEMPDGTILVSGATQSTDFPYTDGTVDANATNDIFLAAYAPNGSHLWTKGFVSDAVDLNRIAMEVHPDGQQLIIFTYGDGNGGNNFTITPDAIQPNYGGGAYDQYIAFLDPATGNTNYGTWYGGTGDDYPRGGAARPDDIVIYGNDILFGGISGNSTDYPVTPGATDRDYGTFLVLNSTGGLEMSTTSNIQIEKMYMDEEVIYALGEYDPATAESSTLNALQPQSNSDGNNRQAVVAKIRRCDGKVVYQTFLGGEWQPVSGQGGSYAFTDDRYVGTFQPAFVDGKIYAGSDFSSLVQPHPTTEGAFQNTASGNSGLAFFSFDLEKEVTWEENVLAPSNQLTCTNGIAEPIDGSRVVIDPEHLPDIIRSGQESYPEQKAVYQWQIASSATGPWTDINGAVQEDYQHKDIGNQDIFLRRLAFNPNECDCNDTLSVSNIHQIQVSNDEAPTAEAGDPARICPGETWPLGGSPSATGGTAPYTYSWEPAAALTSEADTSIANPTAMPATSTIYTLEVLDANGCRALDQVTVTPWTYTAGEDKTICFGESGVRIGSPRPAGASEATYSWSIVSGTAGSLSCTDCPQPIASPMVNTVYAVEVTFPSDNGTTCIFTDQVTVNIASYPGDDFAGPDMATCLNNPKSINGNYDVITLGNPSLPTGPGYTYQWSPLNSFIDGSQQNQPTIEFSNGIFIPSTIPQTYTLTMTTPEGCVYQDQVQVYPVESDLGDDRCAPKVVGDNYNPDIYDGNALYTYNIIAGGGSLDVDNDCVGDDVGGSVSGMDMTWVRVLDDPNGMPGEFTDVEQVVNYDGFICRDTVRIFICGPGNCIFDIEAEGGNCPVVGPDGTLTLVPVRETGAPWPNNGDWTFEWTDAADSILTTDYELNVTDPAQAWYYLKITSTVPVGGNNPCYPDREPRYTMCVDSILVNQPGFARPMIDFPDTTICFGDEVEIGAPGGGFDYEWTDSTGTFESTAPNPMVSPETDATYYVTVTDPITECFTMDTVRVKVLTVPVDAGPDRYICNNAVIQIGADTAQAGLLYQWEPEAAPWRMPPPNTMDADPNGDVKAQPWVLVAADLEFILTVTDTITGCVVRDTVNVYTANSPQVFMSESETICAGESLAIGPMEENPDYLYEWTPATGLSCTDCFSPQASPEMTTNYQLRVRFADPSCPNDTTLNVEVTVNESDITMGPDMNFCPSSASLQIQGAPAMTDQGNAITSYMWAPTTNMNDPTLQTPTVNPPPNSETTYTVTTTDANGCMAGGSVTYTPEAIANSGPGRTLCLGETAPIGSPDNIGSISWTGAGGSPIGALNNPTIAQPTFDSEVSGVGTFQYQVSVTNNGCTTTDMVTVTVQGFDPPEMDPLVLCRNSCGNIGFENNNPDLEFFWSPTTGLSDPNSSMTQVCVDSVDRFYELTIRNTATGCVSQATVSVTVQETEAPQVDIPDVNACFGQQVVLEPNIIPDTGDLTYDWSPTLGLSNPFVRNPILNTEALGIGVHTYELTVVDEHGCINIASMQIFISENGCCTPPVINTIVKDASCGTMDGAVTIVLPENPDAYNIMWSPMSGMISADSTQLENISTGTYQVTVVDTAVADIEACAAEELLIVGTHQEELVVNEVVNEPANCNEGTGGMVQLSPSYYTYAWSDGGTGYIRNDLDAGCYVVEVTVPGSECTDIMEVCVEEAGTLEFTGIIEEPQCETSDGSITIMPVGGTGPYNAQWSDGQIGLERENLMAGVYTVTVTDATGCSGDSTFILSNDVAATGNLTISTVDPECAGEATGSITFGGSCTGCIEPVSVRLLNNGGATIAESSPVTGLKPGNYMVLMEDANGCLVEGEEVILNDPPTMHLDIDQLSTANCNGEYGSIYINVRGGTPEYSYLWGPDGQTTQNLIGVDTGSYTIQVTDANGCMLASDQQLAADSMCCPQIGIQSSVVVDDECDPETSGGTGTAAVVPTGSPSGYTFAWYDSDSTLVTTDSLVTGLEPGAYRVIVRADVPACTDSIEYVLTVGTLQGPQIVINSITDATCLDSDGSVSVSVVEGPEPFTYLWNTGETTPELINVPAGTYWVIVTDSTGCSETEVVTIGQTSGDLALSLTGTDAICNLTNGSASISVTGGTSPYTYQWSNGLSTQTINNLPAGIYSVTVTDANGCMQTGEVAISNTGGPELTVEVATDVLCIGDASGVVNLSSSDPNAILELRDDQGMIVGVGNTVENLWAGTYTVVARAADGCETYEAVTIVQPAEVLDLEISKIIPATCEDELGRLDIDVMGGTGPYTYEWSNGATTEDLEDIASGSYYVVVTDANGCTVEEGYELGQDINCNTKLAFRKEHIELTYTGNPNEFLLEYYLIAENPDSLPGYYSLYDSIAFADGVTVVSTPSVNYIGGDGLMGMINAGFDGVGDQLVMSNDTIGPGTSDTFLISMTLNMDFNIITAESGDCDPLNNTGNTGLTNVGALTSPDSTIRDTVCTPIPVPGVEMTKSIVSDPVPTGVPNEYTMTYVISVEDTTGYRAYYDLSDTIQYGAGATFVSGAVTYDGTDGLNTSIITPAPTDTAYQITDDEWIDSLRTDSFYVEVVFTIDPATLTAESADCDYTNDGGSNSGLTNVAVINDAVPLDRDTVCAPIPLPGVEMTKSIVSDPVPTGNVNEYTMTYVISVEDTTGYRAYYDLSDTLQYGSGATFVSGTVTYGGTDGLNTGIITPAPTDTAYQIADDEWIDSLRTDSFYVEVVFTIDPATLTAASADCDYTNDGGSNSGLTNVAVINDAVPLDRDTVCAPIPLPGVEMTKSIVSDPVPTGNVNEYTMTYVITVEDTTGYRAYYDLSDTIQYGSGATFVSGMVTYGGSDGLQTGIVEANPTDTAYQIADDEWIDSLRTDSFYVEVVFTIDPATLTAESADCDYSNDGGANSGLTNVAVINDAVPLDRDTVCAPIPLPGVEMTKSIVSDPVPTGNVNEYTMTYVISVEDTTGYRAYYDLSDTLQYGSGATFVSGTVTYGGTDGLNTGIITPAPTDTAYQIADDEWIDSLRTDSFYVEVVFTIDPATLTAASADCDYTNDGGSNSGLTNVAVINDAVPLDRDTVCAPIPLPGVEMTKSIVSDPVPTGNVNEYTMTYVISVEDTTGYRAYYDLSDTLQYGSGATFVSGTVTYGGTDGLNTGIITPAPTDTAYQIADDEWIDSLRTDSFYVEVVFTIDPATLTAASADCDYTNDGGSNSGLTNVAVINDAVPLDRDTVCAPIPLPGVEMTKSIVSDPVPTGNVNEYTMTYVITVEDTTGYRAYYDLSDTIQYGSGATFVSGMVTYGGSDGLQTGIVEANPTDTAYQIADDEWIDSLRTDSFYVEVVFTIDPATLTAESADCDYTNDGGSNSGLTNVAVINDAVPLDRDTVCAPIPLPGVEMTKSIVSDPVPTGNVNEYTMTYVISVEDTTGYRAYYDLSDTLQYGSGATFVSGTVTYGGTDGLQTSIIESTPTDTAYQIADDEWIDSLRTDSFYVEVVFTIDPATLTTASADCDYTNDGGSNSGLTNVAVINDAVSLDRDTVCAPIPLPGVEMTKSIVSDPVPTGNVNEYTMTYVITVEDTTGYRAYYDLSDTIQYGSGATFVSGMVTYGGSDGLQTGIVEANPTDTAYQIADDEWIDSLGTDSFYVAVVFTIDPDSLTAESADCDYSNDGGANSGLTNVAVINDAVPLDRDTVCAPIPLPGVEMTKSIVSDPVPTGNVNEYTMTYVISVEDTTGYRAYYDLSDTIQYGSGATFVSGMVTYGGSDGLQTGIVEANPTDTAYQITDDEWIDSLRTDSFYVEVVFTIDPAILTAESADCDYTNDGGSNSGLTNVAVINDAVPLDRDTVCAPIPLPGVEMTKSIVSDPVPTGNVNEYTMTYVISVEDTTGYRAYYDLSDTLQYGSGATFVSGTVTYGGTDGLQTSIIESTPTDTAYQIADDEWIDSLRTDSFYVEVVFTIDPATLTAASADCDYTNDGGSNSGLTNVAVINDAVPLDRDTVCAPIPLPGVEMTKSIVSDPVPTGNVNEYTMTYVISVEDTTGYRAYYDLSDTLQYGSGATFVGGTVTYGGTDGLQTSIIESTPTDTAYQIADDEWIDSLRTDSFYVEVVFTIDPNTLTAASADCDYTNDGGANSGLTNVAVINDAVPLDRDTVCAPIPVPGVELTKSIVSDPVPTGNVNEYTMTYVISVEDTTGYRAYYDLSDTIQYGSGATFISGMVTYGGTDGLGTSIITPAPTDTAYQIADDEWIDSLRTDSFYVAVVFTIDPATLTAASADCNYTNDGGSNSGLTNVAVINDAVPLDRDTVCAPIPLPGVEMTKSIVSDPVPTGNVNEYTMTYVITVEDTTGYRAYYDLSDTLQYGSGATFVSGMVTYGGTDGLGTSIITPAPTDTAYQITDDEWIDSLRTDSFYVAVVFTIDPAILTAESADCDYTNDGGANSGLTNVAVINDAVPLDRDTVCAPIPLPGVEMTKSIVSDPVPTGNVNEYTMTYVITVEDMTGYRAYYDLSDTIQYGSGATFVSGTVTYGGTDGLQTSIIESTPTDTAYQIVDDEWVDSLRTDSFYVEVVFTIDPAILTAESADCDYSNDGGNNSGLTNVAVINDAVPLDRDTVCAPIPLPGVEMTKSIVSDPVPTGNVNEYTMTYVITVEDTTGYRAYYDLSDTIQYGSGATFVSGMVTYGGSDGLQTGIVEANPTDTAYQIADDEWVDSLRTDSFYVEVVFTIDPNTLTAESADCDYTNDGGANSGLTNVAVINDAVPLDRDTVCAPIPLPGVEMTKSIVSDPVPTGNVNEYTMTYVITVEDTTGYRAYYDLSDTLQYGSGATFVSGMVTYGGTDGLQTSIIESTPTDTAYQIADDEWIDSLRTDSFYVEVVFTIDPATLTAASADCNYSNDGGANSGLTNVAVINDAVPLDRDTVCAPIPLPGVEMTKSIVSDPVPTGNVNEYTMTYVISVEDTTGYRAYYDLSDTLQYGSGATFVSGTVTYGGTDGLNTSIITPAPTDTAYQIADDEWVDSLRSDSFYVEVVFTIDPDSLTAASADCDYSNDGGANSGLTNVAVINDAVPLDRDTVCAPIPVPGVELTKSILSDPVPTGNVNEYTMTYVITVEDTTGYRAYYDLSDTLQYGSGADFVSAVVTYGGTDDLQTSIITSAPTDTAYQLVDDEWVDSLEVDSFYVEVLFTIDPNTLTAESADCDYTNNGDNNSGLTNVAVINDGVPLDRDTVCAPIPLPGVEMTKSIVRGPEPTGVVNEYTMTYVISVEDTTGYRAYYDLSDTLQYGSGATFVSGTVTYGGTDGLNTGIITPAPTDTAYQITDDEWIDSLGTDSFYVAVVFTIDPNSLTAESADCDYSNDGGANSGLTNVAVINDAVPLDRDTTCTEIPVPGVLLTKNVLQGQTPTGNVNEFSIIYTIAVEDTTGYRAFYDLVDTLKYGAGADFVSASVTYGGADGLQTSIVTPNPADTAYQIVEDEYVEDFDVDSFYVEVIFTIDPDVLTQESADCNYENNEGQSGLTNVATLNGASPAQQDSTCAQIYLPGAELVKTIESGPTPTGNPLEYTMRYAISVRDTMGIPVFYDLSDTLQYGDGADMVSMAVSYGGNNGLQTEILDSMPSTIDYQIVMDEMVDNFETDIYYIDVVFKTNPETFTPASADCDPTNDNGGFSGLRNVAVIDNAIPIQRDTACAEIPPPCTPVNCYGSVNLSFGANCEIEVTADLLLIQNGLARAFPDQYTVELTYGNGIVIPDNILRPEHVGREIRAKVTSLLEECGGGMCESVIVLDKPSGCIIVNTLDTLVYCIDPFLELSPEDAAYPKPEASRPCSSGSVSLEAGPEWIDTDFACDSDTAEVIYREWYAETAGGESCSAYDTIVVLKLPALTGNEFTSLLEDTLNCELHSTLYEGEPEVEYHAWKQPLGLHNYEQANSGLQGVVYNLPQSILEVAYTQAEEEDVLEKYLDEVVLRKVNGAEYTVGDFVTGEGYEEYLDGLSNTQLSILEDQYQIGDEIVLILELGDWILSSDGYFEQVTKEWLYSGTGNQPYWFAGGWPFILSQENCITYKDSVIIPDENCLGTLQLPAITEVDGELVLNPDSCITLCISEGVHCGISVDSKGYGSWDGNCPSQRSRTVRIHQTCYSGAEGCDAGIYQDGENENSAVVSVDSMDKGIVIELEQWQSVLDTLGPLVDFCYNTEWDQDSIKKSLTIGEIPVKADEYERNHVTVYNTTSHACSAEIFVPSISVRDVCSGIHHVKATLNGQSVLLETGEPNAEGYLTYVHKEGPIELAFRGAEIAPDQVKYEIVDSCWNSSRWHKYVKVKDNRAPEVVVNDTLRVGLSEKITWIPAESLNEGSWDNCGIELELVRRMDWSEGVIDCERAGEYLGWPDILERLGFDRSEVNEIFEGGVFDGDYALDLTNLESILVDSELGKHYFKSIVWLWEDSNCGEKVVHGWLYELALALSYDCQLADDHDTESSGLKEAELQAFFDGLTGIPGYGREIDLLGGGWSKDVPVGCEDACQSTDVEYLAMDHWCNWSKGWLPVEVEDKSGGKVTKVLEDLSLTCESYNMNYESVVEAALDAGNSNNNPEVFANLDSIWGGYIPTWVDNQGRPVHSDGVLFTEEEQTFNYSNITCDEKSEIIKIADTLHDGSIDWIEKVVKTTYLDEKINTGRHGVVGILCSGEVEQDIWVELDDCNQGVITRRFRIQSCSEKGAVIELEQKIYIESACSIRPSMFDLPEEETKVCVPRLEYDGSGNVLLPGAGKVVLKNSLHGVLCNNLAIGYRDKVYKLPGQSNSYVVDRKWEIADWCTSDNFTWMQKVAVEVDPECEESSENNTFEVSGEVFTRDYSTIPKVHISVKSGETVLKSMETNETGYSMKLEEDSQVRIIPSKNDGHKAGLNTADIMAMMRHITGVAQLTTEYDRIAADVDNSGRIDIRDVLELRKLILTPGGKFPNSNSWRFLDMERYRPVYNIKSLSSPMEIDFMGIKVGDLVRNESLAGGRNRSGTLHWLVEDVKLKAGGRYRIAVKSSNFEEIMGLQTGVSFREDLVEVVSMDGGVLQLQEQNRLKAGRGKYTLSWNDTQGRTYGSDEVLFYIDLRAKGDVQLRDVLALDGIEIEKEAYTSTFKLRDIDLTYTGVSGNYALYQNVPNPFEGETRIGFRIPHAAEVDLNIYDVTGRLVKQVTGEYTGGYHEVRFRFDELPSAGVLFYQIRSGEYSEMKQMILIR